jgi:hypothetical protein
MTLGSRGKGVSFGGCEVPLVEGLRGGSSVCGECIGYECGVHRVFSFMLKTELQSRNATFFNCYSRCKVMVACNIRRTDTQRHMNTRQRAMGGQTGAGHSSHFTRVSSSGLGSVLAHVR